MKIAVIGTGSMAHVRTRALMSQQCEVCWVASRNLDHARAFAGEFGISHCTDDYRTLATEGLDAVLIEVPHATQDEIAVWALENGLHTLIGGCLATSVETGLRIARLARERNLIVETGYESRYQDLWRVARKNVHDGHVGEPVAIHSAAYFKARPGSWYYDEAQSGGMPVTHMTYGFLNPIRWIFGSPSRVSAISNRKSQTSREFVRHETCIANLLLPNDVLCSLTGGYVAPMDLRVWNVTVLGTEGYMRIDPGIGKPDSVTMYRGDKSMTTEIHSAESPFNRQTRAFIAAVGGVNECLNPASDSLIDVQVADLIGRSAESGNTYQVEPLPD